MTCANIGQVRPLTTAPEFVCLRPTDELRAFPSGARCRPISLIERDGCRQKSGRLRKLSATFSRLHREARTGRPTGPPGRPGSGVRGGFFGKSRTGSADNNLPRAAIPSFHDMRHDLRFVLALSPVGARGCTAAGGLKQ
jgi:hypothetical protein